MNRGQAGDLIGRAALSAHQKLILLAYMSHLPSDRPVGEGVAWPGLSTLCVWASCSRSTAQAARAELLTAGLLVAVERGEQAMRCRIDTETLAAWPAGERPVQRERPAGPAEDGGCRLPAPLPDTGTPAGNRHRGVPPAGIGGAASRQGGVPVIGTEPSSDNPPHQPSTNNPPQLLSAAPPAAAAAQPMLFGGQVEEPKPARPPAEKPARADEARRLMARLEALRMTRHKGSGLTERVWLPKLTAALARRSAQSIVDGYVWVLRSPGAAFQRGEDGRGSTDYTRDYATVLAHLEYADRRSWRGREGPLAEELADWREAAAAGRPAPEWVQRWRAADRAACEQFERGLGAAMGVIDDDDIW